MPPTTTIAKTSAQQASSQSATARWEGSGWEEDISPVFYRALKSKKAEKGERRTVDRKSAHFIVHIAATGTNQEGNPFFDLSGFSFFRFWL
jgi:hypothetical protein